jgi:hypothetical protein
MKRSQPITVRIAGVLLPIAVTLCCAYACQREYLIPEGTEARADLVARIVDDALPGAR